MPSRLRLAPLRRFFSSSSCPFVEHLPHRFPSAAAFGVTVHADFLSEDEHDALLRSAEVLLARTRFENNHFDGVIHGYREQQSRIASLQPVARAAVERALQRFPPNAAAPLPTAHFLELAEDGAIAPHVDSIKFSGEVVAGLCLVSDAVMLLERSADGGAAMTDDAATDEQTQTRLLLPRRALYILSSAARYEYAHSIPAGAPAFQNKPVPRARRVSVMLRDNLRS